MPESPGGRSGTPEQDRAAASDAQYTAAHQVQRRRAARTVAHYALDVDEARELLAMLGLTHTTDRLNSADAPSPEGHGAGPNDPTGALPEPTPRSARLRGWSGW